MFGRHNIFDIVIIWILISHTEKVNCYMNDVLNPTQLDFGVWHQRDTRLAASSDNQPSCERRNFYICEEPSDTVPPEATKTCNYRNVRYHEQIFRWVAGRGCLLYTPDFLYAAGVNTINLNSFCVYGSLLAPCMEIPKEDGTCGCYPFDPSLEEVANAVREAIIPAAHGRWERCFYAATDCCSHYMRENVSTTDPYVCEATFDGWTCWPETDAGTTASKVCSEFAYSSSGPSCHHYSTKECYVNSTWDVQTDYSSCSITSRLLRRYRFYIAVLGFSTASCLPAVFVFFFYKRLRITRVALHRNLLIAIILRNVFVIVSRSEVYIDELTSTGDTVMSTHGIWCRVLAILERAAGNAVFVCMLVEGIYLHRLIVAVFRQQLKIRWLYTFGVVITLVPVIAWAFVMAYHNDHSCWVVYTVEHIQWILDAPRVTILLINTGLFIDVLRVLLTKLRNSENANQLSTAKATLFLMPIFGTQFLLTAFRPNTTDCTAEQIYYYISYTIEGLQGFVVALLYCYVNKEVHMLVKATYKKTETAVVSRIRRDSAYPQNSTSHNSDRRMTYSTELPSNHIENVKDQAPIGPKLHVAEIISIQAGERLAEILDPVYETIQNGITNEGYDSLERSDMDNDSGIIPNRDSKIDDYYNFTNNSSVSIDCQDWIRCVSSPSSSVYENSLNDYETRYLERKFPNHPKLRGINEDRELKPDRDNTTDNVTDSKGDDEHNEIDSEIDIAASENSKELIDEIMQYIESNDNKLNLDPNLLCPNRKEDYNIIFIED
ncbi:hypothetical protein K1T71_005569 [Dendrolimus kikuchii]|uniref:Uncharacterized protein n=1 Tax=Dendrolimus kikuchii TaxID=765133 RepID=A0ACC1D4Z2_9NEOP|nr:hypothetical protein K1T71_005569 [Dendrolimus kikuchii]